MNIHKTIKEQIDYFIKTKKIPHIIFHGPLGSGKRTLLNYLITKLYKDKKHIMYVNCGQGKGIKFIREELKFFAKSNIQNHTQGFFKTIVLFNADKLTTDAQSALRRCIEQFSHTTRFFIIVEDEEKLLKPIISRFCSIYVNYPTINKKQQNLHTIVKENIEKKKLKFFKDREIHLKKIFSESKYSIKKCISITEKLYNKGFSCLEILDFIKNDKNIENKDELLIYFYNIKKQFFNEKLLIFNFLCFVFIRINNDLENIHQF